jgi:3'(2'), 5'-bisphosphate nucleotidase
LEFSTELPSTKNHDSYKIVASRSHLSHETENYIHIIQSKKTNVELISKGSSLKFCMVAEGVADCYPRFAPTMEWDTAAGHAICKFAGKRVTDLVTNDELVYNGKTLKNNWFIVD